MNLDQEWQNLSAELNTKAEQIDITKFTIDKESHTLLQDLLFKLKWKLRWIRIIDIPLLVFAFIVKGDLKFLLIFIFLTYEISRAFGMIKFSKIKTGIDYNANTKDVLINNYNTIKEILRGETVFGYIFLPLAGPIGLFAYKLFVHQSFKQVISQPNIWYQFLAVALIGIPFIFIASKMNDSIFKKPLNELKNKIAELS
ncbi:hypothetical protein [Pedobacter sp. Leaf170]|uniref:hypothetical protein n=1 Tax=Pedobacter sp. Leaf170 TaxID=2876558 RepID=UPI001E5E2FA0|nr:hypothetical protein [Pedobacter sp. Leaf170]